MFASTLWLTAILTIAAPQLGPPEWMNGAASLTVVVQRQDTGAPIAGASVALDRVGDAGVLSPQTVAVSGGLYTPTASAYILSTDGNGEAVFPNLSSGMYRVMAKSDAYFGPARVFDSAPSAVNAVLAIDPVETTRRIHLPLIPGSSVRGRVFGDDGEPLAGVSVRIGILTYSNGLPELAGRGLDVRTSDSGEYRIDGLAPGEYYLTARQTADEAALPAQIFYPGETAFSRAMPVRVRAGQDLTGFDFIFRKVSGVTVSGTVLNLAPERISIAGLAGGEATRMAFPVFLLPVDGAPGVAISPGFPDPRINPDNPDETFFEWNGVQPGSYEMFSVFMSLGQGGTASDRIRIEVGTEDLTGLYTVIREAPALPIRLAVQNPPSGAVLGAMRPSLRLAEFLPSLVRMAAQVARTEAMTEEIESPVENNDPSTRNFTVAGLPEARYSVLVQGLPSNAYVSDLRAGGRDISDSGAFDFNYSNPESIDIVVRFDGGSLTGFVHDGASLPAPGAGVALVPTLRRGNINLYKRVVAGADGRFRFDGVAPGLYRLFAWNGLPAATAEQSEEFLRPYEAFGHTVSVFAGQTVTDVQVRVIPD